VSGTKRAREQLADIVTTDLSCRGRRLQQRIRPPFLAFTIHWHSNIEHGGLQSNP